jgi:RNA polymerase-binding transcription factor DksA
MARAHHGFPTRNSSEAAMPRIAMPTQEYRRSTNLDGHLPRLRELLEEQRRFRIEQLAQLATLRGQAKVEVLGRHLDDLDASADNARVEVSAAVEAAARQALDDIELALDRIQAGRYGHCGQCGTSIPIERLYAIPQAGRCMRCQSRLEARR